MPGRLGSRTSSWSACEAQWIHHHGSTSCFLRLGCCCQGPRSLRIGWDKDDIGGLQMKSTSCETVCCCWGGTDLLPPPASFDPLLSQRILDAGLQCFTEEPSSSAEALTFWYGIGLESYEQMLDSFDTETSQGHMCCVFLLPQWYGS